MNSLSSHQHQHHTLPKAAAFPPPSAHHPLPTTWRGSRVPGQPQHRHNIIITHASKEPSSNRKKKMMKRSALEVAIRANPVLSRYLDGYLIMVRTGGTCPPPPCPLLLAPLTLTPGPYLERHLLVKPPKVSAAQDGLSSRLE